MTWQLQDAKNRLSELVETSLSKGPQIISRRGKDTAVLMSFEDYTRYTGPKRDLKKTLMSTGFDTLDLKRDKSTTGRATPINFK
jgi:antitoxin Phd